MRRIPAGLGVAAAVGLAATLSAQSPTTSRPMTADKDHDVTVTGCLAKAPSGFTLTNARVEANPSTSTTTATGSTTTAGTTGSTSTTTAGTAGAAQSPAMTWMVSGDNDLEKHVGHKVSLTGKTSWDASMDHTRSATTANPPSTTTGGATTTSAAGAEPRLDVKSIKMVSVSCP